MNTTQKKMQIHIDKILMGMHANGFTDSIAAGQFVRDHILLPESEFDPSRPCTIYYSNLDFCGGDLKNRMVGSGAAPEDVFKDIVWTSLGICEGIESAVYILPDIAIIFNGADAERIIYGVKFKSPYRGKDREFEVLFHRTKISPVDFVGKAFMNMNKCLFDRQRYRLYDDFISGYRNKIVEFRGDIWANHKDILRSIHAHMTDHGYDEYQLKVKI